MKAASRKGFIHVVEIVIIVLAVFVVLFQFIGIPSVNTKWSEAKLNVIGNDLLFALDGMGIDWTDRNEVESVLDKALERGGTRNTTIVYDLKLNGVIKPNISVGCICRNVAPNNELAAVEDALQHFYLNGINISYAVDYVDPAHPEFSHKYDVVVIMSDFFKGVYHPEYSLDDFKMRIENYLGADKGILVINYSADAALKDTIDEAYFGINWSDDLTQDMDLELSFNHDVSFPNSSYYDVFKYFYNFPNSSGIKTKYPNEFFNLLDKNQKTTTLLFGPAGCELEDNNGICGLIVNRGMVNGQGRTAWLSRLADPPGGMDDSNNVLMRSIVAWLAGDSFHVIDNEDMKGPVISRLYKMNDELSGNTIAKWGIERGSGSTMYDKSGNANHGMISGAEWADSPLGKSLLFDRGDQDYIEVRDSKSLNRSSKEFTIIGRFNISTYFNAGPPMIFPIMSKEGVSLNDNIINIWANSGGGTEFETSFYMTDSALSCNIQSNANFITRDVINFFALVFDGDYLRLYMNGASVPDYETDCAGTIIDVGHDPLYIGKAGVDYFNGRIDNMAIFSKAMTPDDINKYYNFPDQFMFQPTEVVLTLGYIY